MNIQIIAVGKIREKYIKDGVDEFVKRIKPYSSIKVHEVSAETLKYEECDTKAKEAEANKILNIINENSYVVAMEINGKQLSSENLASKINELSCTGYNQVTFVIGGAVGLDKKIADRANFLMSISKMTFPHQLARLILLEQIYRAFKIIKNEPYHK